MAPVAFSGEAVRMLIGSPVRGIVPDEFGVNPASSVMTHPRRAAPAGGVPPRLEILKMVWWPTVSLDAPTIIAPSSGCGREVGLLALPRLVACAWRPTG